MENSVGINIEVDLDLRYTARCWRNIGQVETAKRLIVLGYLPFTLQHVHRHRCLVVVCGREDLIRLGGNSGVLFNQPGHYPTECFDTKRQRGHIQQQNILDFTPENAALNGRPYGNGFIRVYITPWVAAKKVLYRFLHLGHARLAAH